MRMCTRCRELADLLSKKDRHIRELETKVVMLEYDLKQMREKWFSHKKKKEPDKQEEMLPKKRGAPVGHEGWFRKMPETIDVTDEVPLNRCPNCGSTDLSECDDIDEHIQEDIVMPKVKVTKYRHHLYWCKGCKEVVMGQGQEEIPNSYIGPKAKGLAALLKYKVKVSQRDIQALFEQFFGLRFVPSAVPGFHNQLRIKGAGLYDKLKDKIKKAPVLHADETGCPVDGNNWWDWVFASSKICLHAIQEGRGQKEVEKILGKTYNGILISDFLSAYNAIQTPAKQRCLVHLLRDLKKALECTEPTDFVHIYCQRFKNIIQTAIELSEKRQSRNIPLLEFKRQRTVLCESLKDFQFPDSDKGILRKMALRLKRHKDEMFTFLYHPGLPYHNNLAERLIRPSVILRKISFGHRSDNGVQNHNVLMSLQQTALLNKKDPFVLFQKLLTSSMSPSLNWCLGP